MPPPSSDSPGVQVRAGDAVVSLKVPSMKRVRVVVAKRTCMDVSDTAELIFNSPV